jgi:hypothetical protein
MDANQFTADILADTQRQLRLNQESSRIILENSNDVQQTLKNIGGIYDIVASDAATVKSAETAARLTSQTALKAVANGFGVNINDPANRLVQLAIEKTAADKAATESLNELNRRATKTPADGILDYVGNQIFGVYDARQKFRADVGKANLVDSQIKEVNQNIQQTAVTYRALEESVTAASADAASRMAASDALIKSQTIKLEGLKYDSESILKVREISQQSLSSLYQAKNAIQSEQQLQIALDHLKLSKEQFDFSKEHLQDRQSKKEKNLMNSFLKTLILVELL